MISDKRYVTSAIHRNPSKSPSQTLNKNSPGHSKLLFVIKIMIRKNYQALLFYWKGQNPEEVSKKFCLRHHLPEEVETYLLALISKKIDRHILSPSYLIENSNVELCE